MLEEFAHQVQKEPKRAVSGSLQQSQERALDTFRFMYLRDEYVNVLLPWLHLNVVSVTENTERSQKSK